MSTLKLKGSTSGYVELTAPATAGDNTITLPTTAGTVAVKDASNNVEVGTGVTIGSPSSNVFTVSTNGSERVRVTSDGKFAVGTNNPQLPFVVSNNGALGFEVDPTQSSGTILGINAYNRSGSAFSPLRLNASEHRFDTSSTERVRINSNGLTFNGDTAAANALDDYEEGTWTPTITVGGDSLSIDNDNCSYVKVGQIVTCWFEILGINTPNSSAAIFGGMPFSGAFATETSFAIMLNGVTYPSGTTQVSGYSSGNSATFRFFASGTGATWVQLTGNNIGSGDIIGTIVYRTS